MNCGFLGTTPPNFIGGDNATGITFQNVTIGGGCPRCGGDMKVVDGTYDFAGGVMTAFRQLDAAQLRDVESLLRQGRAGELDQDQLASQVAAISPELGAVMRQVQRQPQWTSPVVIQVLLAALAVVLTWMTLHQQSTLTASDHEALQHDIREAIESVQPTPPAPPARSPRATSLRPPAPPPTHASPADQARANPTQKRKKRPGKIVGKHKAKKRRSK